MKQKVLLVTTTYEQLEPLSMRSWYENDAKFEHTLAEVERDVVFVLIQHGDHDDGGNQVRSIHHTEAEVLCAKQKAEPWPETSIEVWEFTA